MIHQYKLNGYNIVLDVYSGSVHAVDELAYAAIALVDAGHPRAEAADLLAKKYADHPEVTAEDINDCFDDIEELKADGKLFAEDIYADHAFDFKNRSTVVKALCLHVAHTCNLNCEYCFAAQGKFHGQSGLMSFETGKRALDFLVEHSGTRHNLEVDFFGGEPLMNFEVCKQLVAYARSIEKEKGKNFRFTLTTNGIGITDEVIEWANKECYNVVLSLDGRKEINDRFRKDIAGRGSYDRIVPKFQQLVKARGGKGYYMRGTFTHYNTDFTNDLFHMADDLGFDELSMEPVVSKAGSPEALTEADLPILFDQYELLAKDMLRREKAGHPITFYHYMIDLAHGPCIYKRISGCGSGTEYMAVTPWGDLYPCHQFVGRMDVRPDAAMGYAACLGAEHNNYRDGNYGAGTGASVGKMTGMGTCMKSGIGSYAVQLGDLKVGAIVAVNSLGDIYNWRDGHKVAGMLTPDCKHFVDSEDVVFANYEVVENKFVGNTTIGAVFTNAKFDKAHLCKIAAMTHDGYARAIRPVHTANDGDSIYAVSLGDLAADQDVVGALAARVMAEAILRAVQAADSAYGFPAAKDIKR